VAKQELRPVILDATAINVQIADQIVLNSANITIHKGECVAVVGRNGVGKSTLFKVLAGADEPNSGNIARKKNLTSYYLPQEVKLEEDLSVYENIYHGAGYIVKLIKEFEQLDAGSNKSLKLEAEINARGGWDLDNRIKEVMSSLCVPAADKIVGKLSGGEKRRVGLCRAIVGIPELLLLDEPTNHLDAESIGWLSSFLSRYKGTCLMVTHDRFFLDSIATRIVEIANGELYSYIGNYGDYLIGKAKRAAITEQQENKRQSYIRNEIDWIRRGPKARGTKSRSRIQRFYDAVNQQPIKREENVDMIIPTPPKLGNRIVQIENLTMNRGGKLLYKNFSFNFVAGSKIGIVGRNGMGKTTFLMNILGKLAPDEGKITIGDLTQFNYVDQHRLQLNENNSVFEEISEGKDFVMLGNVKLTIWGYLKRFLFTDDRINSKISRLSGGERSRLLLAKILKRGGNFLILDEPTNDLDLPTLRILEEALNAYNGVVLVVSHDRYFMNRVCTGIMAFEGDGKLVYQEGGYDYYEEKKREREKQTQQKIIKPKKDNTKKPTKNKKQKISWKEQKELESMEEKIMLAEEEAETLEKLFSQPDFYNKHGHEANKINEKLATLKNHITQLYDRWEKLEELANT